MADGIEQQDDTQGDSSLAVQESTSPGQIGEISFDVLLSPREIIAQSQGQAKALMEVVEQMKLYQVVRQRKFLQVEAWQMIGQFTHTTAIPDEPVQVDDPDRIRYKCTVELRNQQGEIVGAGSAEANSEEEGKSKLTENQIASTAQTRAISKAYRNKFAFIAKLAGFEATTAEEMTGTVSEANGRSGSSQQPPAQQARTQPPTIPPPAESQLTQEPPPTAPDPPPSTPEELKAYIECKEACFEFVDTEIFIETAIGLGYEGKRPSTLTTEELSALLGACKAIKEKADEPEAEEPIEPFPTPTDDEVTEDEKPTEDEAPF